MTVPVSGHTRVAAIIGDPVAHSRSPTIHNAAYAAVALDWVYVAFRVAPGSAPDALHGLATLGAAGCNVTMPHKHDAALACDELSPTATTLAAANCVCFRAGRLVGDSTDGPGFIDAACEAGIRLRGATVLVLGAGGAARAIVHALGGEGAHVVVAGRRAEGAAAAAALAPDGRTVPWEALDDAVAGCDVLVNATPIGMGHEPPPFTPDRLTDRQVVIDTVYEPTETPLLRVARERGARALNGIGMLVHQAARSFTLLTGCDAPLPVMWAAARDG